MSAPARFTPDNTCIVLLDIWGLDAWQILALGSVYDAWRSTRLKIAKLVEVANEYRIPLYFNNNQRPIPSRPAALRKALLASELPISRQMFGDKNLWQDKPSKTIHNTVNPSRFENLIYAGYAADACLAIRKEGYRILGVKHNPFLIKDATLVQFVLYHGKREPLWPKYSKVMKARSPEEPLPWKMAQDLIDETLFFCDSYASRFAAPLTVAEFREMLS